MSAEYDGKMDADKTIKALPRPLTTLRDRVRALNLTGDETGALPTDQRGSPGASGGAGQFWNGTDWRIADQLDGQVAAHYDLERAIDAAWYD